MFARHATVQLQRGALLHAFHDWQDMCSSCWSLIGQLFSLHVYAWERTPFQALINHSVSF
jgi:hypothetical protein